jgi:hypothetical protein
METMEALPPLHILHQTFDLAFDIILFGGVVTKDQLLKDVLHKERHVAPHSLWPHYFIIL